jgi:hypothetical protein
MDYRSGHGLAKAVRPHCWKARAVLAAASACAIAGAGAGLAAAASAATTTSVTATTQITDRPDGGNGAGTYWADDNFTRTLTITADATATDCGTTVPAGGTCYLATLADSGTFTTIPGRGAPNPNNPAPGADLTEAAPAVTGSMTGNDTFHFFASGSPDASLVPASENDEGNPPTGNRTTSNWFKLAFPSTTTFTDVTENPWSWTYKTACEQWTDSSTNNAGDDPADGNITGKACLPAPAGPGVVSSFTDYSRSCLDNSDFTWKAYNPLQLWTCGAAGGVDQQLKLVPLSSSTYELQFVAPAGVSGSWCVTAPDGVGRLVLGVCKGAARQAVTLINGAGNCRCGVYYKFGDSGLVMDDWAYNARNGAAVGTYSLNGGRNQGWGEP